jgi:hypothetical protein
MADTAREDLDRIFNTGGVAALVGNTYGAAKDVGVYVTGEAIRGLADLEAKEPERCANFAAKAVAASMSEWVPRCRSAGSVACRCNQGNSRPARVNAGTAKTRARDRPGATDGGEQLAEIRRGADGSLEHSFAMVRSLSQLRIQAEEEVSKTASSETDAARPFYHRAAALLAALRFYAQERGLDDRWVQAVLAPRGLDVMREVAQALQQQGDAESVAAARFIDDLRVQGLRARRCVLATANITLWRLSNLDAQDPVPVNGSRVRRN